MRELPIRTRMGLPSQRSDDDSALVDEIVRSIDGADDPKRVRSLLNAWWRYAGVRAAAGAEVDAEKFLAERSSLGLLELPLVTARAVIELEFAIANGPQGPLPVVVAPELTAAERPIAVVPPASEPEPELEDEPVAEIEADLDEADVDLDDDEVEPVAEAEPELEPEPEIEAVAEPEVEAELEPEPEPEIELEPEPEIEPVAEAAPEIEPEQSEDDELEAAPEVAAYETQLQAELDGEAAVEAEPEPEFDDEPEGDTEPEAAPPIAWDARDRFEDREPISPTLALVPEPQPAPDIEREPVAEEPEPGVMPEEAAAPIPVAALLREFEEIDPPAGWEALDAPVPITHFERFRRDRADRSADGVEHAKFAVYAGLVMFFSLAIGLAMAASLVITHISLPVPGADAVSVVAPWRAWLAIVTGLAGVVVATVIARRHDMHQVLFGPRIGLGGLAVTGIGLLAGSVIAAVAGGVVLVGGAALGAVRRA
jgi:hypothetical protein